jgi:hypothetical protein
VDPLPLSVVIQCFRFYVLILLASIGALAAVASFLCYERGIGGEPTERSRSRRIIVWRVAQALASFLIFLQLWPEGNLFWEKYSKLMNSIYCYEAWPCVRPSWYFYAKHSAMLLLSSAVIVLWPYVSIPQAWHGTLRPIFAVMTICIWHWIFEEITSYLNWDYANWFYWSFIGLFAVFYLVLSWWSWKRNERVGPAE